MAGVRNRRAIRWLRSQLPELIASGVISSENARAIDGYYEHDQPRVNFAFVILAALGSALVAAGIILLIAHNWDDLSRATRTGVAFLPLLIAQALVVFTLMRRNESRRWRHCRVRRRQCRRNRVCGTGDSDLSLRNQIFPAAGWTFAFARIARWNCDRCRYDCAQL